MFVFGIIAGWTNENISVAMILMIIMWLTYNLYDKNKVGLWLYFGLLGMIVGFVFMIQAPGNFIRAAEMHMPPLRPFYLSFRIRLHTLQLTDYLGYLNMIIAILGIIVLRFTKMNKRHFLFISFMYSVGVLISVYSMVVSPYFPARAWFGIITLNLILFGIVLYNLNYEEKFIRFILYSLVTIAILIYPCSFYFAFKDINRVHKIWQIRENNITKAIQEGKSEIVFETLGNTDRFVMGDYKFYERVMSQYHGIKIELNGARN